MSLAGNPFHYRETKAGHVHISYRGKVVTTLRGREAERFRARIGAADPETAQQLMARATGQFKRGNERLAERRGKRTG